MNRALIIHRARELAREALHILPDADGPTRRDWVVSRLVEEIDDVTTWEDTPRGRALEHLDGEVGRALLSALVHLVWAMTKRDISPCE